MIPEQFELAQYTTVFLLLCLAVALVIAMLTVVRLLAPVKPNAAKQMSYECGEEPLGNAWLRFNVRFYIVALVFVLFDVELVLVYPVACILREVAEASGGGLPGWLVLGELFFFLGVLFLGLVYIWRKGDLGWIRSFRAPVARGLRSWPARPPSAPSLPASTADTVPPATPSGGGSP